MITTTTEEIPDAHRETNIDDNPPPTRRSAHGPRPPKWSLACDKTVVPYSWHATVIPGAAVATRPCSSTSASVISVVRCWWRRASRRNATFTAWAGFDSGPDVPRPHTRLHQGGGFEVLQAFADLGWGRDQQRLELIGGLGASLDRAAAGHPQRPDRFDDPVAGLRDRGAGGTQGGPGRGIGIDRVRLALRATSPPVRRLISSTDTPT
ncbi:MAG: hypothetical protein QOH09_145 [Pseudonocardiales bacterium]|nr:hypothetical protein [Pseudonocardiales bacterium]